MIRHLIVATGAATLVACGEVTVEVDTNDDGSAEVTLGEEKKPETQVAKPLPERGPGEIVAISTEEHWVEADPENTLYIDIPQGRIVVLLTPDLAQAHVEQVKKLAREGYYDGLHFYRVVHGFVAQGGDESGEKEIRTAAQSMQAEFDEPIPDGLDFTPLGNADGYAAEAGYINGFPAGMSSDENKAWLAHCTGAFAFGRNNERDSAATEFYITLQPQRYLDRNLSVFGRVIWGMDHVQAIPRGAPGNGGVIADKGRWTQISSFRVAADLPENERLPLEIFNTNTDLFRELIEARRNRPEGFFYYRPDYLDLCQLALPVRLKPEETEENAAE